MDTKLTPQMILERIPALAAHFRIAQNMRKSREVARILVVEDQLFSRKILQELLHHTYVVDVAENARDGMKLYLETAPDIALLDIELADESGHTLARFIKSIDQGSFVVMVTGNNSVEDVALAKSNQVDGFIVKPYNKSKIFECIDKYLALHPARQPKGQTP
ncbi:MAG: response regulator [Alphaproteobacteria bacterium]|nr:response regulator [Alphaproteobacteria bacterium]